MSLYRYLVSKFSGLDKIKINQTQKIPEKTKVDVDKLSSNELHELTIAIHKEIKDSCHINQLRCE